MRLSIRSNGRWTDQSESKHSFEWNWFWFFVGVFSKVFVLRIALFKCSCAFESFCRVSSAVLLWALWIPERCYWLRALSLFERAVNSKHCWFPTLSLFEGWCTALPMIWCIESSDVLAAPCRIEGELEACLEPHVQRWVEVNQASWKSSPTCFHVPRVGALVAECRGLELMLALSSYRYWVQKTEDDIVLVVLLSS